MKIADYVTTSDDQQSKKWRNDECDSEQWASDSWGWSRVYWSVMDEADDKLMRDILPVIIPLGKTLSWEHGESKHRDCLSQFWLFNVIWDITISSIMMS